MKFIFLMSLILGALNSKAQNSEMKPYQNEIELGFNLKIVGGSSSELVRSSTLFEFEKSISAVYLFNDADNAFFRIGLGLQLQNVSTGFSNGRLLDLINTNSPRYAIKSYSIKNEYIGIPLQLQLGNFKKSTTSGLQTSLIVGFTPSFRTRSNAQFTLGDDNLSPTEKKDLERKIAAEEVLIKTTFEIGIGGNTYLVDNKKLGAGFRISYILSNGMNDLFYSGVAGVQFQLSTAYRFN